MCSLRPPGNSSRVASAKMKSTTPARGRSTTRAAIGIAAATMAPTTQLYTEATSATIVATIPSASATATWDRPARTARPPGMLAMAVEQLRDHVLAAIHEGAQHVDTRALEVAQEHGDLLPRGPA